MNLLTLTLVMFSAFGWSLFDISRKKTGALISPPLTLYLYMLMSLPIFLGWAAWDTLQSGSLNLIETYWPLGLLGVLVNFLANWSFIESVSRSPLSQSVPMLAFIPVFSSIFSFVFLGEVLNLTQMTGIAVVVVGSVMLNGRPRWDAEGRGPWLMFWAALCWSVMLVIDKICLRSSTVPVHASVQTIGIIFCALLLLRQRRVTFHTRRLIAAGGFYFWLGVLACFVAGSLQLVVMPMADIGVIEAVKRAANMSLSLFFGYFMFGESVSARKVGALAVLLVGTFLVLQVV